MYRQLSLSTIEEDPAKKEIYLNVLNHIHDNAYPEMTTNGKTVKAQQAFSIQNVAKMALATQNILPGNWYGVG